MGNKLSKAERSRIAANETYFVVLASTRASLLNLLDLAFIGAMLLALVTFTVLGSIVFFDGFQELLPLFYAHIVALGLNSLVCVVSLFRRVVFRFQIFFSSILAVCAVTLVYAVCLMFMGLAASAQGPGGIEFPRTTVMIYGTVGLLYVCGATVVHVVLLRKRLREGHSESRTLGNLGAASSVYRSKGLWFIVAAVTIVPNVLTLGQYLVQTFGVISFLFIGAVTPSLPVEFSYLAYLKSRDKRYWEVRPRERRKKGQARTVFKKIAMWVGILIAVCVAMGIAGTVMDGLK